MIFCRCSIGLVISKGWFLLISLHEHTYMVYRLAGWGAGHGLVAGRTGMDALRAW